MGSKIVLIVGIALMGVAGVFFWHSAHSTAPERSPAAALAGQNKTSAGHLHSQLQDPLLMATLGNQPFILAASLCRWEHVQTATFGNGCFWCTEAVFQQLKGVHSVVSGYSGGTVKDPTYKQVSTGTTGHAEVIQITFDPTLISYADLLEVFWQTHDPTTLNRQGPDFGTQYRSVVFYHTREQEQLASACKKKLDAAGVWDAPVVTEITRFSAFYSAEAKHQNFFVNNPRNAYCVRLIGPKLEKFQKVFKDKLKTPGEK